MAAPRFVLFALFSCAGGLLAAAACGSRTSLDAFGAAAGATSGVSTPSGSEATTGTIVASGVSSGAYTSGSSVAGTVSGTASGTASGSVTSGAFSSGATSGTSPSCNISASNYRQSCALDTDCVAVNPGNYCGDRPCFCSPTAAINYDAVKQFTADVAATPAAMSGITVCNCPLEPVVTPCCTGGICGLCRPSPPPTCISTCKPNTTTCVAGGVATCVLDPNGCWTFAPVVKGCGPHQSCVMSAGVAACECRPDPFCTGPAGVCVGSTVLVTCAVDAQGCAFETGKVACPPGSPCTNGACTSPPDASAPSACPPMCATVPGCSPQSCYVVSASPTPMPGALGFPNNKLLPPFAVDGLLQTRYASTTNENGNEWFQIDLCKVEWIDGLTVKNDYDPALVSQAYAVQVSPDGQQWTNVWGSTDPAPVDLTIMFSPIQGRFVRYLNTAGAPHWWAIDEISVQCDTALP